MKRMERVYQVLAVAFGLVAVILAFRYLTEHKKEGHFAVKIGDNSLDMQVKDDGLSLKDMLDRVFQDEAGKVQAKALLSSEHGLYALDDPAIEKALLAVPSKSPLGTRLQEMARLERGPFKRELIKVRVSFPENPSFVDGNCVVCSGSDLYGCKLVIYDAQEAHSIALFAGNPRPCRPQELDSANGPENIQITMPAARSLFGTRPLGKYEDGWVGRAE